MAEILVIDVQGLGFLDRHQSNQQQDSGDSPPSAKASVGEPGKSSGNAVQKSQ